MPPVEPSKRVAIYIRVSTLDQAREGYSLAAQQKTLEDWSRQHGHTVYHVYEDAGKSGKDIAHRPALQRLISDASEHKFDLVVFWALSRFTRSIIDLYQTIEYLASCNVSVKSYTEPFDTSSAFGRFNVGILGLVAQLERELTAERVKLAMTERAAQGKRTCNEVLGYDLCGKDSLSVNDTEAERIRFVFAKYLEHRSLSAVAELCNLKGYTGKRGCQLRAQHIKTILTRPVYAGYNSYNGQTYRGDYDPIISEKTFKRVQTLLRRK